VTALTKGSLRREKHVGSLNIVLPCFGKKKFPHRSLLDLKQEDKMLQA